MAKSSLLAALAITSVSALQIPLQLPLEAPKLPWISPDKVASDATPLGSRPVVDTEDLQDQITQKALLKRAEDLYEAAKAGEDEFGHPTRVIGSEGHAASLNYILETLEGLDGYYDISTQTFPAVSGNVYQSRLVLGNTVPNTTTTMGLTPPTKDNEPVFGDVILVENEGCNTSDFPESVYGNIALIKRGTCGFGDKSENAGRAGAIAAIVYNYEDDEIHGTLSTPSPYHVATFGLGGVEAKPFVKQLEDGESVDAIAFMDSEVKTIMTDNIMAQTVEGDPDNCVMLGGHSDSVPEGPGINDDGSGSLSILEVAVQLTKYSVNNCVRFAWWAAEEEGLLGSDYYVSVLPDEENKKIRLFMDYDMMGSPNYAYQIYNATNEDNPEGSAELKQLYVDWYEAHDLNYTFIPFDGRSDYDGFIRNGIPGGGIATGAEGVKTKDEAESFGGREGHWYDPCYHQLCDDVSNVNLTAWEVNTKLIAHSVATYAVSFKGFPERAGFDTAAYDENIKYHGHKLIL